MKIISYLEFKLNKEMAYENTFGKEEKEKIKRLLSSRRSNNLPI